MSIYRAKMPDKYTANHTYRKFYTKLTDEWYNEIIKDILTVNSKNTVSPCFSKNNEFVFAICDVKPIDSELFKWEEFPNLIDITNRSNGLFKCLEQRKKRQRRRRVKVKKNILKREYRKKMKERENQQPIDYWDTV